MSSTSLNTLAEPNGKRPLPPPEPRSLKKHKRAEFGVSRTVSACQRCRSRKTRCDQKFPSCTSCLKAGVECVGVDAATGREVPRSYVYHLENRVVQLEKELSKNGLEIPVSKISSGSQVPQEVKKTVSVEKPKKSPPSPDTYLGSSSGISFARLLFTAVKFKPQETSILPDPTTKKNLGSIEPAPLPSKEVAENLLSVYFSQANPQLPILHREQFLIKYFKPIYGNISSNVSLASDFTTIGVPTCSPDDSSKNVDYHKLTKDMKAKPALYFLNIVFGIANAALHQKSPSNNPERFHLAALKHMESVFSSSNRLEALQGILLLALYSLMRPAVPGVWYVLGSATRLCVDLGLHTEGGMKSWYKNGNTISQSHSHTSPSQLNVPEYDAATLDFRRRLFWCTYALDRQVCVYLGRPFSIPEHTIRVPFPSELDDSLIVDYSSEAVLDYSHSKSASPSYKTIALSFFKIRKIHAEIQSILYECASLPRQFSNLDEWKAEILIKLEDWYRECPCSPKEMNCNFNLRFIELNYYQSKLLLYGLCPAYTSPPTVECYQVIAESAEQVILNYLELNNERRNNYTWVVVHNLFMAGTSYLYAIYHSPEVRANTDIDKITRTAQCCLSVLSSMVAECDAASTCCATFELMTAAILKLCFNEQAGLVMQLPNGKHVNKDAIIDTLPSLSTLNVVGKTSDLRPQVGYLLDSLPRKDAIPNGFAQNSNTVLTDLDSFFKEAAQMDGISPNSTDVDLNPFNEFQSTLMNIGSSIDENVQEMNPQEESVNVEFESGVLQPQQPSQQPKMSRNDGQRIYDIINEVPMAAIWDQFFAPINGIPFSSHSDIGIMDSNGNSNGNSNGISSNFGSFMYPDISGGFSLK